MSASLIGYVLGLLVGSGITVFLIAGWAPLRRRWLALLARIEAGGDW